MLDKISHKPNITFKTLAAFVMERVPVRVTGLNKIMKEKQKEGLLDFDRPRKRGAPSPDSAIRAGCTGGSILTPVGAALVGKGSLVMAVSAPEVR